MPFGEKSSTNFRLRKTLLNDSIEVNNLHALIKWNHRMKNQTSMTDWTTDMVCHQYKRWLMTLSTGIVCYTRKHVGRFSVYQQVSLSWQKMSVWRKSSNILLMQQETLFPVIESIVLIFSTALHSYDYRSLYFLA